MLKKYALVFVVIFLFVELADAQSFYRRNRKTGYNLYFGLGTASYQGDLKAPDLDLDFKGAATFGAEIPFQGRFRLRGELGWYRIQSDDKRLESDNSPINRNLSFRSDNLYLSALGVIEITPNAPRPRTDWTTYAMAGLGVTYFNPKAELNGTFHKLQPLMTEGVDYSRAALLIPVGAGINYRINYDWSVSLEGIYNFTTTDYLDDVSTEYVDNASFTDPIAAQLADRRPEIGLPVHDAGVQRGDPDDNDGYLMIMVKAHYHFNQGLYYKRKKNRRSKVFRR